MSKEQFLKNYTGIYDPEKYYNYLEECEEIEKTYKNATYNESYNRQLEREAKQKAFNKHLRK